MASIIVQGVVGPDIEANSITANEIAAGTITAEEIAAYSINVDRLSVGDNSNMIADPLLGDADLNENRVANAEQSSAGATTWEIVNGVAVMTKVSTAAVFNRFPLVNNVNLSAEFQNSFELESPGMAIQITKPSSNAGGGNLMGRFRVTVTQGTGAWTGQLSVAMLGVFWNQYGAIASETRWSIVSSTVYTGAGTGIQQSSNGAVVPEGSAFFIPYIYITAEEGVPADVTVAVSEFEVWQEASVYIGDGRISAPLIQADAITTDKLQANAITAKHTIQSAQYIMNSAVGNPVLRITNNGNFVGQAGIRWDGPSFINAPPRIFMVDSGGTGGWDANGLVMCGPETTVNDSGRIDIHLAHGITNTYMKRSYGVSTQNQQGIIWATGNAQLRVNGQHPSSNFTNDRFRAVNFSSSGNANVWSLSWGAPNWVYFPVCTPAFASAGDSTNATDATCLVTRRNENGMRVTSSRSTNRMHILAFTGGGGV